MKSQKIENIKIAEIRIVNPRSRNRKTFRGIVGNISTVGLKKPITVHARDQAKDGTRYDLVCGQGRLEAIAALGGLEIPAILTNASLKQRYLMSLVENVARKRPPLSDLLREVRRLMDNGDKNTTIARKLGMGHTYVDGIVRLIRCGENRLVEQVEGGTIPLSIAIKIATADDILIQRSLSEAYENGTLRGAKFVAIQRLVARRNAKRAFAAAEAPPVPSADLAKEYERHTERQRELVGRAIVVRERFALLVAVFKSLLADQAFIALLKEQGLDTMPQEFAARLR